MEPLLLLVSKLTVRAQHDLQVPRKILFGEELGHSGDSLAFFARDLKEGGILPGDLGYGGISQETDHLPREMRGTVSFADEVVYLPQDFFALRF